MKKYRSGLLWVEVEGEVATIGLLKKSLEEIGKVSFIELPKTGDVLKKDERAVLLECNKAAIDIESPLSGEVAEVNASLLEDPSLLNRFPESRGWLYKIKNCDLSNLTLLAPISL